MADKIVLSWSGGKDSALALEKLMYNGQYQLCGLFTTYNVQTQKINLHNVPIALIRQQAESLGLSLYEIPLPPNAANAIYEDAHKHLYNKLNQEGITHIGFGDIFIEEIKSYRENIAQQTGLETFFPLWQQNTEALANEFITRGFKAIITALDTAKLGIENLGRLYDEAFIAALPDDTDFCGEHGEFHTFVFDGPIFRKPVKYFLGDVYMENYKPAIDMEMAFIEIGKMSN
ncbi:MAG: Dph6-related ATP pyrophosphatase [Bacteroidia bacterium]